MLANEEFTKMSKEEDIPFSTKELPSSLLHFLEERAARHWNSHFLSVLELEPVDVAVFVTAAFGVKKSMVKGRLFTAALAATHIASFSPEDSDEAATKTSAGHCKGRCSKRPRITDGDAGGSSLGAISELLKEKIVATVFFEPSTRTRCSFEAAVMRLGGRVLSCGDLMGTSALKKGESFEDTIKMLAMYSDAVILRHFEKGSASKAALLLNKEGQDRNCCIINAGDGAAEHPTQALLDIFTIAELFPDWWRQQLQHMVRRSGRSDLRESVNIQKETSARPPADSSSEKTVKEDDIRFENVTSPHTRPPLVVAFIGDLRNGRTVHSLAMLLSMFNCRLLGVSAPDFMLPDAVDERIRANFKAQNKILEGGISYISNLSEAVAAADVLYISRVQLERLSQESRTTLKESAHFRLTRSLLEAHAKPHLKVLHPLPRLDELETSVDETSNNAYFVQAENGVYMRMALLAILLNPLAWQALLAF